jgi:hypothetical protein
MFIVPKDDPGATPTAIELADVVPAYNELYALQQQAVKDAKGDEYLASLLWEREQIVYGKNKCSSRSNSCFAAAGLLSSFGEIGGFAGEYLVYVCGSKSADCTTKWENELYRVDRAIADFDKCTPGDQACYERVLQHKAMKLQPLPAPGLVRSSGGDGSVGGGSGHGPDGPPSGGLGGNSVKCVESVITADGKEWKELQCFLIPAN